ncbi:GNAT family N-acetyltransferase [Paludisphaera soli]|uniref:GNAT family N-acetyltransferase n=1 Tax=Paludisphaera soli TaxID=2712865 RepID=UPI0013EC5D3D|nr:GNAT family N-acetyltransferase [Paludisphaera soli]
MRELYREEMDCQIVRDSWHARGWTDSYLLRLDGRIVGYGLVGAIRDQPRETVMEFYVLPAHRGRALFLFRRFVEVSGATLIEAQTNDLLLTLMLYDCAERIESNVILFYDAITTSLSIPGAVFREVTEADKERITSQGLDADSHNLLQVDGVVAATGGLLFHYNVPYGDIYMATAGPLRGRGYGSYLIQELKRLAYEMGKVPAARCNVTNSASRATLQKAGMLPCARFLSGVLKPD